MKLTLSLILKIHGLLLVFGINEQTNAPSIQRGITFQCRATQTVSAQSATIQNVTVIDFVFYNYGVPVGYKLT